MINEKMCRQEEKGLVMKALGKRIKKSA